MMVPVATYRIQFSLNFHFVDARDLVPYLRELGITHLRYWSAFLNEITEGSRPALAEPPPACPASCREMIGVGN